MSLFVPKFYHIMDVHKRTWSGYGKSRLSIVTYADDPVPIITRNTLYILNSCRSPRDYIMVPKMNDIEDWQVVDLN